MTLAKSTLACALILLSSCAFTNPKNTPMVTALDTFLGGPEKTTVSQTLAIPVALPLGAIDVAIVHPISVIDDAAKDTWDLLWEEDIHGSATRTYLFLPRLALTPIIFAGDWLGRSLFDIPPYGEEEPTENKTSPPTSD